ncbi:MAG: trypsin-like peptidase domain-containing protein [Candidatus Competibacteraceae bacterium]|nr:trypsin-like peptidase domain-containing protein [Candidatus Competibacteraceae bacterium]
MAIRLDRLPEGVEVRFFGANDEQVHGPFTVKSHRAGLHGEHALQKSAQSATDALFWSPVIEGETAGVEIYVPGEVGHDFSIEAPQIQHLVYSVLNPDDKALQDIGRSGACNIDVKCRTTTPNDLSGAVAKIIFTDGRSTFLCTGTLLNDQVHSRTPYFMTANHCVSTQSVADTINSYWFFERATCGGSNPTAVTQFSGGATLLATGTNTDFTFLQLRDSQISSLPGIHFAGWTTADPTGRTVIGLHHPGGGLKKWSQGTAKGFDDFERYPGPVTGTGNYIRTTWSQGVTESGSSGSGLFAVTGEQGGQQLFVGNLFGGSSACANPSSPDWYGRFDLTYPSISRWLAAAAPQARLESPEPGSFESGIGLIRGWVCDAGNVEIQINDRPRQRVAYGSRRADTIEVCGNADNGFGFTVNWNNLGDGVHSVKAFADGVEFAQAQFTVTTLGVDFLRGFTGEYILPNFPQTGRNAIVRWSEPHQNFVIASATRNSAGAPLGGVAPLAAGGRANLESPAPGSFESGLGLIRGWACDARSVEIQINDGARQPVAYGTRRADTIGVCGHANTGFGYTVNWNNIGDGAHTVRAFIDGVEFAQARFTVTTLGADFLRGASGGYLLPNFPQAGRNVTVRWSGPHQNFVIVGYQ